MALTFKDKVTRTAGKLWFKTKKHSPEILFIAGIGAGIGGCVWACKQTLKLDETIAPHREEIEAIKADVPEGEKPNKEQSRSITAAYLRMGLDVGKLYLGPTACGIAAVFMLGGNQYILNKRNSTLMAAVAAERATNSKLVDLLKENGIDPAATIVSEKVSKDENGEEKVESALTKVCSGTYSVRLDATCKCWRENRLYMESFLRSQQATLNRRLHAKGHLFLNEVRELLELPPIPQGQLVGWVDNADGSTYVSLGIDEFLNGDDLRFMRGEMAYIDIDPNVEGVIWDKI